MGDKTDIGVSTRLSKIHSLRGRYFLCASVHNCRGNGRDIGTLTQVLWWGYSQRTRNGSLIVVGEGGRRGQITVILQTTDSASDLVWARESPSERVVYFELSHNYCCVFVVSTARIIRLKHDSIGKLNLNFVLKVPLIMQN